MDIFTLIFMIFGFAALIVAFVLEGGVVGALLQPTAAIIVFGGLIGAVGVSFPIEVLKRLPRIIGLVLRGTKVDKNEILNTLIRLSTVARRDGLLALEQEMGSDDIDEFMKTGLRLIIDGADEEVLKLALETRIINMEHRHEKGIGVFEAAGGYAPTMGVIGTVMGLVHVLGDLSEPEKLGGKIAVAFIATLYGVGSANLLFLPIATKLKELNTDEILAKNMMMEGLQLLRSGSNPAFMKEQLKGYLDNESETEAEEGE